MHAHKLGVLLALLILPACGNNNPPPKPDLGASLPESLDLQGNSGTTTLTLTPRNGFTGTVSLSLVSQSGDRPLGFGLSPTNQTVVQGGPTPLTLTIDDTVALGSYPLKLQIRGGDLIRELPLNVRVSPPPGDVTLTVDGAIAAAYQVGSGSWAPLKVRRKAEQFGQAVGAFSLGQETRFGVAILCGQGVGKKIRIVQVSKDELPSPNLGLGCWVYGSWYAVDFSVTVDIDPGLIAPGDTISLWGATESAAPHVTLKTSLPAGPGEFVLLLTGTKGIKVAKLVRLNVTSKGTATVTVTPDDQLPVTTPNLQAGDSSNYWYGNTQLTLFSGYGWYNGYRPVSGADGPYVGAVRRGTGLKVWQAFRHGTLPVQPDPGSNSGSVPPAFFLPTPWKPGSLSVTQTVYPTVGGLVRNENDVKAYRITSRLTNQGVWSALVSKGWLGGGTSYTLPDLSNQLGYSNPVGGEGWIEVAALLSNRFALLATPNDVYEYLVGTPGLGFDDYVRSSEADGQLTVGGGTVAIP